MKSSIVNGKIGLLLVSALLLSGVDAYAKKRKVEELSNGPCVTLPAKEFSQTGIVPKGMSKGKNGYTVKINIEYEDENDTQLLSDDNIQEGATISIADLLGKEETTEAAKPAKTEEKKKPNQKPDKKKNNKTDKNKTDNKPGDLAHQDTKKDDAKKNDAKKEESQKDESKKNDSNPAEKVKQTEEAEVTVDNIWTVDLKTWADSWKGVPYRSGGMSKSGTDCSGFSSMLYKEVFQILLQRQSKMQYQKDCKKIIKKKADLQKGDLLFFVTNGKSMSTENISHVGVYVGDNIFVHASSSKGVVYSSLLDAYYVKTYLIGGRVIEFVK